MKEISKHCSHLCQLFSGYEPELEWKSLAEWLNIASGIVEVRFDLIRFNESFGWCSTADEFDSSREEILQQYITELTRFSYVWGALEAFIDEFKPPPHPDGGKINSLCFYLKNNLDPSDHIYPYIDLIEELKEMLSKPEVNEVKVLNRFKGNKHISSHGIGLYVIYMLRNLFSHGALQFPYPDENNEPNSFYPQIILLSSRIVLLTIQMVLLAYYQNTKITTRQHWENYSEEELLVESILRNIHLAKKLYKYKQLKLC